LTGKYRNDILYLVMLNTLRKRGKSMEDRFLQQLKKGVLELLVLEMVCREQTYGYELLNRLSERSGGLFQMKEGTLYPILYRLEDEKFIESVWSGKPGRSVPKKMYTATHAGHQELQRRKQIWSHFEMSVDGFLKEEMQ